MIDEIVLEEIPESWKWVDIKKNIEKIPLTGKKLKKGDYQERGNLPVIDQGKDFIGGYTDKTEFKIYVDSPLVIFGDHTRCFKYVDFDFVPGADGIKVIKPSEIFNPKLFFYFLQAIKLPNKGYARHFQYLEKSFIPLPPLNEQKRIVSKIEELLINLNDGVQELTLIKEKLKAYRTSVLKHAFEGKLTEKWRETHSNQLKNILEVEAILQEKRCNNQLKKFKDLPPIKESELPNTPKNWLKARIWEVSDKTQYGTSEKANDSLGTPVLRMGNIKDGKLFYDNLKYMNENWEKIDDFVLENDDVLFNRTNSKELVGKTAVYKSFHPKSIFASYLIRIKLKREICNPDFLSFYINSYYGRKYISSVVSQQVGQANVNGTKLSLMPISIPPIDEQIALVKNIESKFALIDEIKKSIDHSIDYSQKLRQSILKKAFLGKLIPQDFDDESVEKPLESMKTTNKS